MKKKKKEDKLQQKFEAQGLQNCRSRNVDLNFGTQGTNKPKENNREKKTKENFVHLYASWERERWTPPSIHGQHNHFLDWSTFPAQTFGRNSTVKKETLRSPEEALSPPTPVAEKRLQLVKMTAPNIYIKKKKEKKKELQNNKKKSHFDEIVLSYYC